MCDLARLFHPFLASKIRAPSFCFQKRTADASDDPPSLTGVVTTGKERGRKRKLTGDDDARPGEAKRVKRAENGDSGDTKRPPAKKPSPHLASLDGDSSKRDSSDADGKRLVKMAAVADKSGEGETKRVKKPENGDSEADDKAKRKRVKSPETVSGNWCFFLKLLIPGCRSTRLLTVDGSCVWE